MGVTNYDRATAWRRTIARLRRERNAAAKRFRTMTGDPNEIAAAGGYADGLQHAVDVMREEMRRKVKP
jgi:uncharacterized protein (DUF1684 family)